MSGAGPRRLSRRRFLRFATTGVAAPLVVPVALGPGAAHASYRHDYQPPRLTEAAAAFVDTPDAASHIRPVELTLSTDAVFQGGALQVRVPRALSARAKLFGREYPLQTAREGPTGYIGIGVLDPPGEAVVEVEARDILAGTTHLSQAITVQATDWSVAHIWLPEGVGDLLDPALMREERELLAEVYGGYTWRQWEEPWLSPIEEDVPITSPFGEQRSFNGGPVGGHHGGTDFGAVTGTAVLAANNGTVVLARELAVRGKMVIVDHGSGVYTGYAHLSEIDVSEGGAVQKGQVVGLVGTTGLSTGPHLHWEHAVLGVLVDGLRWLDGSQGF